MEMIYLATLKIRTVLCWGDEFAAYLGWAQASRLLAATFEGRDLALPGKASVRWRWWPMPPVPFIHLFHQLVELLHLLWIQDLADAAAGFFAKATELRIDLLLQIPHLLRGLVENLTDLLNLGV